MYGDSHDTDRRPALRGRGRHRGPRRLPGLFGLAAVVSVLLVGLGVGAALLPSYLAGGPESTSTGVTTGDGAGNGLVSPDELPLQTDPATPTGEPSTPATPSGSPSPSATPTSAGPSPTPKASKTSATPRRTPSRTPTTRTESGGGSQEEQVVAIVNQRRAEAGCGAVRTNADLAKAARLHSEDQAAHNRMSHEGSNGSSPWQRAEQAGYQRAISENVAAGYRTPAAVMEGWMNSPGHRANILNCDAKAIGMGIARSGDGTIYWTQMFGSAA
ncbi:CAP domain-containing protein [Polymorphospora sp. A560]|uniref:CAP domain-containing protein n=1 Tax=Polymorphospora sp. A560 TaxID=3040203 RepID=UPI003891C5D9